MIIKIPWPFVKCETPFMSTQSLDERRIRAVTPVEIDENMEPVYRDEDVWA